MNKSFQTFKSALLFFSTALVLAGCTDALKKFVQNSNSQAFGVPTTISAIAGDQRAASAGSPLPGPLTVHVQDGLGNSVAGTSLSWAIADSGGTLTTTSTVTDDSGNSSNTLTSGQLTGTQAITVTAVSSGATGVVNARALPAALGNLQMDQVPTSVIAGATFPLTVYARDIYQNVKSDFTGTVHFTSSDSNSPVLPADYTFSPADQGVHIFNIVPKSVGAQTVQISSSSSTPAVSVTSPNISVSSSVNATALAVVSNPQSSVAGSFINSVTVNAVDAFGNTVTDFNGNVIVSIGNNPGSGNLAGTLSRACVNGVATFDDLKINAAALGYTLQMVSTGLTGATSGAFNITASTANSIAIVSGSELT